MSNNENGQEESHWRSHKEKIWLGVGSLLMGTSIAGIAVSSHHETVTNVNTFYELSAFGLCIGAVAVFVGIFGRYGFGGEAGPGNGGNWPPNDPPPDNTPPPSPGGKELVREIEEFLASVRPVGVA